MSHVDFRAAGEAWGGKDWQRPLARALVAAGLLHGEHADTTVRRYASGTRGVPDEIMAWLTVRAGEATHWIVGRTERGSKAVAHLVKPRFYVLVERTTIVRIEWIDPEPDRRTCGKLLAEAAERGK